MVGHVIREVTNAVIRHLLGGAPLDRESTVDVVAGEANRYRMAAALGVHTDHPSVALWFEFQRSLHALDHFRPGGLDENESGRELVDSHQ